MTPPTVAFSQDLRNDQRDVTDNDYLHWTTRVWDAFVIRREFRNSSFHSRIVFFNLIASNLSTKRNRLRNIPDLFVHVAVISEQANRFLTGHFVAIILSSWTKMADERSFKTVRTISEQSAYLTYGKPCVEWLDGWMIEWAIKQL